jgi:hypothetical protein
MFRLALSSHYRSRLLAARRVGLDAIRAFSRGAAPVPWSATMSFVVIPGFLLYLSNGTILGAIDTRPVIPTAISLVRQGDWELSEFVRPGRSTILHDRAGHQLLKCFQVEAGGIYSGYPPGMVMFAVPVTAMARICGADLDQLMVHRRLEKITASLVAALGLGLFFLTACCLGSAEGAAAVTLLMTTCSAIYTTVGLGLWQHGGIVLWLLTILLVEFRRSRWPSAWHSAIQGAACGGLLMCRPTAAILVVGFGTWVLLRSPKYALRVAVIAAAAYAPCLLMYYAVYGNVFGPHAISGHITGSSWRFGRIDSLVGILASPARGLFVYQPWLVLAFLGLSPRILCRARAMGYRGGPAGWMSFCLVASVAHCGLISCWCDWAGGGCWGSRLLTDILPLLGLMCVPTITALWPSPRFRTVIVSLGILGALTHLPAVYMNAAAWNDVSDHSGDLWSWSRAPFLYRPRPHRGPRTEDRGRPVSRFDHLTAVDALSGWSEEATWLTGACRS